MNPILLFPLFTAFFATFLALPGWIKKMKKIGLVWRDMNKRKKMFIAGSGGIIVILGFILGVLFYIALKTFYFQENGETSRIFGIIIVILILSIIGLVDDLMGWHHGGLSKKFRLLLCILSAVPLMVINSGNGGILLPFIGKIDLGIFFPLILVPLGITGAATTFNFLAGYNGLEAGLGMIILAGLGIVSFLTNHPWLSIICFCMFFSLLAFWLFNKFPARIFPGDVLTYPVGGLIASVAILGNFEKIAVFFFLPYIIETILKLRGNLEKQSFGKINKDNSLDLAYKKIYSLNHAAIWILKKIKKKVYEKDVVRFVYFLQIITILTGFWIFRKNLF